MTKYLVVNKTTTTCYNKLTRREHKMQKRLIVTLTDSHSKHIDSVRGTKSQAAYICQLIKEDKQRKKSQK